MKLKTCILFAVMAIFSGHVFAGNDNEFPEKLRYVLDWAEKSKSVQNYTNWAIHGTSTEWSKLWSFSGGRYSSRLFKEGSRISAISEDDEEDYSDPFAVCLHLPQLDVKIDVSQSALSFYLKDQIQVACGFGRNGGPIRPHDAAKDCLHCTAGTHVYSGTMRLGGKTIKVKFTNKCTHKMYQTPRTTGMRARTGSGASVWVADPEGGASADPYAPWRIVHVQTTTFNLDEMARLNGMSKRELVMDLVRADRLSFPVNDPSSDECIDYKFSSAFVDPEYFSTEGVLDESVDVMHLLLKFFLCKTFKITPEDYAKEAQAKMEAVQSILQGKYDNMKQGVETLKLYITDFKRNDQSEAKRALISVGQNLGYIQKKYYADKSLGSDPGCKEIFTKSANLVPLYNLSLAYCSVRFDSIRLSKATDYLGIMFDGIKSHSKSAKYFWSNVFLVGSTAYKTRNFVQLPDIVAKYEELLPFATDADDALYCRKRIALYSAAILNHEGKYKEAIKKMEESIKNLDAKFVSFYEQMGIAYVNLGEDKKAMKIWNEEILKIKPDYASMKPELYYLLGLGNPNGGKTE